MHASTQTLRTPLSLDASIEARLLALCADLDGSALRYCAGFFAGIAAERDRLGASAALALAPAAATEPAARATVLYASQTGNGRRVAEALHRRLESQGLAARLVSAADFKTRDLAAERLLFVVASTHGDGDPPDDARGLFEFLGGRKAPRLERLGYSVLALGDSSYPRFCETGRLLDERLAALGARPLTTRIDCDVDYQDAADGWAQVAVGLAREHLQSPHIAIVSSLPPAAAPVADRDSPVETEVLVATRITGRDSERAVVHIELAAPAAQLAYEPGDAVGIWHANPVFVADRIAAIVGADPDSQVTIERQTHTLRDWLVHHREVTRLARPFVEAHAVRAGSAELDRLRADTGSDRLRALLRDCQPIDVLERWPARWDATELVKALRPLTPRLYSIASSRAAVGEELHLTVAAVDYVREGARRIGAASHYLATLDPQQSPRVRAYIEPNARFRLPADDSRDIVMIGAGTGVAPFRGFLQQRAERGGTGRNWLLFGGRHLASDFLYQAEWLEARRAGSLHRLDVAFSRDQVEKVYVQQRIVEHGAELLRWIEGGAHLYVCGDAQRMAPDVHAALRSVFVQHGRRTDSEAEEALAALANERRYARDVY